MTYQVLALKWRPRSFSEIVGQSPTVKALIHALDHNRLHHAYLFTGTRGVGKTSIARLLAKCMNCERGVSSQPCGHCTVCQSIEQGRFLDLLEIDAASRTKVEDTRELLDNVQYAPTQGRFKVYLIDEVHMLSNHSFNALLKTLEEPPPHVKFLLATTDPQRLPITVLSRCLQLHLHNLSLEQIQQQLAHILTQEAILYETPALSYLAQAAQGSMRDALTLLDQAISYGKGQLQAEDVRTLLGKTEDRWILEILQHIANPNPTALMSALTELLNSGADCAQALEQLLTLLHRIAVCQLVPEASTEETDPLQPALTTVANQLPPETIQLYYQIALMGRRDLPLAPTPRSGLEMVLLRMLAFQPVIAPPLLEPNFIATQPAPTEIAYDAPQKHLQKTLNHDKKEAQNANINRSHHNNKPETDALSPQNKEQQAWADIVSQLPLQGSALVLASHCAGIPDFANGQLQLLLEPEHSGLHNPTAEQRLTKALADYWQKPVKLQIAVRPQGAQSISNSLTPETPAQLSEQRQIERQQHADKIIQQDTELQKLISQFEAKLIKTDLRDE